MIIGNLTSDPKLRSVNTANGPTPVCDFTVAVNRRGRNGGEEQTDFFRVSAWRGLGENCQKYLAKGRKVAVVGPVSGRIYTGNDGVARTSLEVHAEDVEFLSSRQEGAAASPPAAAAPAATAQAATAASPAPQLTFTEVNEDLPF